MFDGIEVVGAREHNLKSVSVQIPRKKITVITGLSGSGKSSLAFDTIYAEGQRRYIEGLSVYARQFLDQLKKPDVDAITGLSPAIAIDQKSISTNPRSTVGTVTEIFDYFRLLFAKAGVSRCPQHGIEVASQSPESIVQDVMTLKPGTRFFVLAAMARGKKGEFQAEFLKWIKKGFTTVRVDGDFFELAQLDKLAKSKPHNIDLVVDRLVAKPGIELRLAESINSALALASGRVLIEEQGSTQQKLYSISAACPVCGYSFPELEPRLFSFNNPKGACQTCNGLGTLDIQEFEQEVLVPSAEGMKRIKQTRYEDDGDEDSEESVQRVRPCPDCQGLRLRPEALNVFFGDKNIAQWSQMAIEDLYVDFQKIALTTKQKILSEKIVEEILLKLSYLIRVGTGYLSLDRPTRTLSGGEAQRIRLASQVGSSLVGILYVLDEPSIGLHPRDHHRLLGILREAQQRGNTILMVEHDEDTMREADHLIDLGPRAGRLGGELIAMGTPNDVSRNSNSLTGAYLAKTKTIALPSKRKAFDRGWLEVVGATGHNLKSVHLKIPLGTLCGVSGVSGSGKSTLVVDTLFRAVAKEIFNSLAEPEHFETLKGLEHLDKVVDINQKPIGRTPRSVPATYVGLFPMIRDLFAVLPESKLRGFKPGQFSFNVKGGRCEACNGGGQRKIEMHFLADVFVPCEICNGERFHREILRVQFKGKSIADVLAMSVLEAEEFFRNQSAIHRKLKTLIAVGLDYMQLGQSSTTLSGGEAQRVKLAKELSRRATGRTLYILDEPTTGLHFHDVAKLLELLVQLTDQGNTVLVIEHNLDVLKVCDFIVDLGPEGGHRGGEIVAQGRPEEICANSRSITGEFLKSHLS